MTDDLIARLNAALEDRYRIVREIGEGGMATVFLADDVKHERQVALKVLKPELAAVLGAERFLAEIRTTAHLQHPNILPLFDSGEADRLLFYVMPYVDGESLRDRLAREKQLPVDEAVRLAADVAEALQAAHDEGVIHRDIKPANILLSRGRPLVADFGIALAVSAAGGGRLTETGLSMGTPFYMSPEQAAADREASPASDVYSLACVLYEMLTGDPPHTGSTAQAVLARVLTQAPEAPREARPSVPLHVDAAIRRALERVPADRFASAEGFAKALGDTSFRHGDASSADLAAATAGPWKGVALALAVAVAVLGTGLVALLLRPSPDPVVSRYRLATELAFDNRGTMRRLEISPAGDWWIQSAERGDGTSQLWLRRRDQLDGAPIQGTEGAGNPAISPDGSRIAFLVGNANRDMRVVVSGLAGESPIVLADSLVDQGGLAWGDDGYIYFDGAFEGDGLARVSENGGAPEVVTVPGTDEGELWHAFPEALPGGGGLLFIVYREDETYDVAVADLATREHRVLVRGAIAPQYARSGHIVYVTPNGDLAAVPFDPEALEVTGEPVTLSGGVEVRGWGSADVALSDDGTLLYAAGDDTPGRVDLAWIARDGTSRNFDIGRGADVVRNASLSPGGDRLAVAITGDDADHIYVKRLPDGRLQQLTTEGHNAAPLWVAEGTTLAFLSIRGGDRDVYRRAADGSSPAQLVLDAPEAIGSFDVSNDGRWLVYDVAGDIFAVELDAMGLPSGEPVDVRVGQAREYGGVLSPDGRWMAYMSFEAGARTVQVCPFPACAVAYRVSSGQAVTPAWSPDGSELVYMDATDQAMTAVEIGSGPPTEWGTPRTLFPMAGLVGLGAPRPYVVATDGSIMLGRRTGRSAQITVVENFFEVLRQRVPR